MAFYETVMAKGYATPVDPDAHVDVSTGMIAAGRLQALIESRASGTSMMQLIAQLDRIIRAIHDSVPQELWDEILRKIDGPVPADRATDDIEDYGRRVSKPATLWCSAIQFSGQPESAERGEINGAAAVEIGSVVVSWVAIHTVFTLRCAQLYYSGTPGGIDFNQPESPAYVDFGYLAPLRRKWSGSGMQ